MEQSFLLSELSAQKYALDQAAIVAATDAAGVITYVNQKFCEISGYSSAELLGNTHRIINSGYHDREFFKNLWKTIRAGEIWRGEICNRAKDGHLYWVYTTIVPFRNQQGEIYQFLSIRQDITELKQAQQTILQQQEQIITASRLSALGEMAAILTHEINNPLGVILGRVEMLLSHLQSQNPPSREEIIRQLKEVEFTAGRIEKIMRTVKSLAHPGAGSSEPKERVSLAELLQSVMDLFSPRAERHGLRWQIEGEELFPLVLESRPTDVFQILANLLTNALDAVKGSEGEVLGTARRIGLRLEKHGPELHIIVFDEGPGIPDQVLPKLFTPFFTTKKRGEGTGLGLTVSQALAHRLGGRLEFLGNHPTRFALILPLCSES